MEDGPSQRSLPFQSPPPLLSPQLHLSNGDVTMANFPALENSSSPTKVNGETACLPAANLQESENEKSNSDCDNLVIDESVSEGLKSKKKKDDEEPYHTNPYFAESIFELTNHYKPKASEAIADATADAEEGIPKLSLKKVGNRYAKKVRKNGKPKLREYAQYLGLQPTVQFKCSKCGSAGFESLQLLNEHLVNCTAVAVVAPTSQPPASSNNSTNFKVTRKVFLCSACGTYYENWNLFLHMREVHKRFICLYCLGMFPHAEKLSLHLVAKHNCAPQRHATASDFFDAHKQQPCFLTCCDCQTVFNEQDDVTQHMCISDDHADRAICDSNDAQNAPFADGGVERAQEDVQVTTNQLVIETSTKDGEMSVTGIVQIASQDETTISDNDVRPSYKPEGAELSSMDISDGFLGFPDEEYEDDVADNDEERMHVDESEEEAPAPPMSPHEPGDERKVPKVTLKLKLPAYTPKENEDDEEEDGEKPEEENDNEEDEYQSEDSEKLTVEIEKENGDNQPEKEEVSNAEVVQPEDEHLDVETVQESSDISQHIDPEEVGVENSDEKSTTVPTAGSDVVINEIELEQPLDKFDIKLLLQKCLQATIPTCLYCNHARKISVNGKQLGLHAIAEHRYSAIVKSITAEELIPESFNTRIQECLDELDQLYFNLEDTNTSEGGITFSHVFECFQCRYSSTVHKELYVHNRKLHAKALLLCIMCKTSFYSYSELICHLCPGVYSSGRDVQFRCCMCVSDSLPSAFRLMVHLRKKHHACDVCLEMCHNQSRLSSHVWKHKLHHLCYRCGIAYRNKPDITKHLFWKHGTESVECKKCLQKKWPHVYHFCMPPISFACDLCTLTFSRASRLMVHKRLHAEEFPHACIEEGCTEKFISKKLLTKHLARHRNPNDESKEEDEEEEIIVQEVVPEKLEQEKPNEVKSSEEQPPKEEEKPKPKVDVYDLPELNLSESDSDSEDESTKSTKTTKPDNQPEELLETSRDDILDIPDGLDQICNELQPFDDQQTNESTQVLDIWDNFKNYQANIAKNILSDVGKPEDDIPDILTDIPPVLTLEEALRDHDYCPRTTDTLNEHEGIPGVEPPLSQEPLEKSADHDYCTETKKPEETPQPPQKEAIIPVVAQKEAPNTNDSNASSSDSDSSSCTCGSNCSCSSSSDSSSSSSDSSESDSSSEEGRRNQQVRREKRRGRKPKAATTTTAENGKGEPQRAKSETATAKEQAKAAPKSPKELRIEESDLDTTESDTDEDFYDKEPQKLANKLLAEKKEKLMQLAALGPYINGSMIDSRPATPSLPEEVVAAAAAAAAATDTHTRKKSKNKKKKKKKKRSETKPNIPVASVYHHPTVAPLTLTIPKNSPSVTPSYNSPLVNNHANNLPLAHTPTLPLQQPGGDGGESGTRASKRRRVPNKFYGYSSDEEGEKNVTTPAIKFRKVDLPTPKAALTVPPITIKTTNSTPTVDPISIRVSGKANEMRVQPLRFVLPKRNRAPPKPRAKRPPPQPAPALPPGPLADDSGSDSATSSDVDEPMPTPHQPPPPKPNQPALYCYCRCPYDEVSEMIGCDSDDCAIEWFHFECVGIMVPPKGQWFCPDCRKKKQQRREMLQQQQQLQQHHLAQEN